MGDQSNLRQMRFERACWWLNLGADVVPLKPCSKELYAGYGSYGSHINTVNFAHDWFLKTDANLGVVLGGRIALAVADWDSATAYASWCESSGATVKTLTEQSVRGCHMFFLGVSLPSAIANGCEFKTSGVCTVSPSVHPSGAVYRIVENAPLTTLSEQQAKELFPFLSEKWNRTGQYPPDETINQSTLRKRKSASYPGQDVVSRIKNARSVEDEIRAAGILLRPVGEDELVGLCPFDHMGRKDSKPSLWVNARRDRWGCYSPACESNSGSEKAHDVLNFRALRRNISIQEAIREMAREFL